MLYVMEPYAEYVMRRVSEKEMVRVEQLEEVSKCLTVYVADSTGALLQWRRVLSSLCYRYLVIPFSPRTSPRDVPRAFCYVNGNYIVLRISHTHLPSGHFTYVVTPPDT
ncbi:hypothetical protein NEFER03_0105 [Nematocida sp. LUAm3]|nr:hypothetical protein NEFER03_0105 [Nematocida sp. LUAm3]KAI5173558.1 hypothetical protein NEFER02_0074 [Nematocida sp. LUAm2]KAI5176779.1 hypothetical protein NEFER01_0104 [Nematocida sp. LUAm1]